jgi:hypothetical protein
VIAMSISFTPINKAIGTDAADMPHVLGDPADTLWQGVAERSNANLAAFNGFTDSCHAALNPSAELSGTAVLTPASEFTLTGGYAYARTTTFLGGYKAVQLELQLVFTPAYKWIAEQYAQGWQKDGAGALVTNIALGTLVAALRPTLALRTSARFVNTNATTPSQLALDILISTAGAVGAPRSSAPRAIIMASTYVQFSYCYLTAGG